MDNIIFQKIYLILDKFEADNYIYLKYYWILNFAWNSNKFHKNSNILTTFQHYFSIILAFFAAFRHDFDSTSTTILMAFQQYFNIILVIIF
jgi:hypothetical protein